MCKAPLQKLEDTARDLQEQQLSLYNRLCDAKDDADTLEDVDMLEAQMWV